jgi:hypothetical protein
MQGSVLEVGVEFLFLYEILVFIRSHRIVTLRLLAHNSKWNWKIKNLHSLAGWDGGKSPIYKETSLDKN